MASSVNDRAVVRISRGVMPKRRLNARLNEAGSPKPFRAAISVIVALTCGSDG